MARSVSRPGASRRRFLKTGLSLSAAAIAPTVIPGSALGLDGTIPPSERVVLGGDPLGVARSLPVGDPVPGGFERGREVLHGRQQQDELLAVPGKGGTLGDRFEQEDDDVVAGFTGDVRDGA
jgi:hypothetical protein